VRTDGIVFFDLGILSTIPPLAASQLNAVLPGSAFQAVRDEFWSIIHADSVRAATSQRQAPSSRITYSAGKELFTYGHEASQL
jgi:hypothetical protein